MIGQRGRQRLQLRILRRHLPTVPRVQSQSTVIHLDQHAIAVEFALERVFGSGQLVDRTQSRQHRGDIPQLRFGGGGAGHGDPGRDTRLTWRARPAFRRSSDVQSCQQVTVFGNPGQHLLVAQLREPRICDLLPGAGRGDGGRLSAAQRVRGDSGLRGVVLAPVQEDLPRPQTLGHGGGHQCRHALLELLSHPASKQDRTTAGDRISQRSVEVQTLAAAGKRVDAQADVIHQFAHRVRDFSQVRHRDAFTGIEVEYQSVGGTGLAVGAETPLRHMDFQRCLLGNPGQSRRAVDDRIDRGTGAMDLGAAGQPVRGRPRQVLLEKRRCVDTVGPAFSGGRTTGDMRQHHLGDGRVIPENICFGGAGGRVEHLVRVGQLDQRTFRRSRRPHIDHQINVLPADTVGQ